MKVSQLDYSAIQAANQTRAAANQAAISVQAQTSANGLVEFNNDFLPKYIAATNKAKDAAEAAKVATTVTSLLTNVVSSVISTKQQADTQMASNSFISETDGLRAFVQQDTNLNQGTYFTEDGLPTMSEAFQNEVSARRANLEALDVSDDIKSQILDKYDQYVNDLQYSVYEGLYSAYNRELSEQRQWQLDEATKADIALGDSNGTTGEGAIRSWGLPSAQTERLVAQYKQSYAAEYNSDKVRNLARSTGTAAALDYVSSIKDSLNEEEISYLTDLARQIGSRTTASLAEQYAAQARQQLQGSSEAEPMSPNLVLDTIETEIKAAGYDSVRSEAILTAVDGELLSNGLRQLGLSSEKAITSMTGDELNQLAHDFNEYRDTYFPGERLQGSADAIEALIAGRYRDIDSGNAKTNIAVQKQAYAMAEMGAMTVKDAAAIISEAFILGDSDSSDEQSSNDYLKKLYKLVVPSQFEDLNDSLEDRFESLYSEAMKLDSKDAEDKTAIVEARTKAHRYVLGRLSGTPVDEITDDLIKEAWQDANDLFFGEAITELQKMTESGRSLIEQGSIDMNAQRLSKATGYLMDLPEGAISYDHKTKEYDFFDPMVEQLWNEQAALLEVAVRDEGIYADGFSLMAFRNEDGHDVPIPVMTVSSGDKYMIFGSALLKQKNGESGWTPVKDVASIDELNDPFFTPGEEISSAAPSTAEDSPLTGDARNVVYGSGQDRVMEGMLSSEEQSLYERVAKAEGETPSDASQQEDMSPASEAPDEAIDARQEAEPEKKVRIVQGVGTEFWYEGTWYIVSELPENSEVLAAYDRLKESFGGSFPRDYAERVKR